MVALRAGPNGGFAPIALAILIFLLTPTAAGYQDLGALIAQQPQVEAPPVSEPGSRNPAAAVEPDAPDLSILEAAADPDPGAHTAEVFFGGPMGTRLGGIEPWGHGEEPILMLPRRAADSDIKL